MRATQLTWTTAFAIAVGIVVFALPQPEPLVIEASAAAVGAPAPADARLDGFKEEVVVDVDSRRDFTQQMVDMIYSFNELGFQEFETQRYVTGILENNGFTVELGVAGIPSAWWASWGSGAPVIWPARRPIASSQVISFHSPAPRAPDRTSGAEIRSGWYSA